jgi:hypothetical protein
MFLWRTQTGRNPAKLTGKTEPIMINSTVLVKKCETVGRRIITNGMARQCITHSEESEIASLSKRPDCSVVLLFKSLEI